MKTLLTLALTLLFISCSDDAPNQPNNAVNHSSSVTGEWEVTGQWGIDTMRLVLEGDLDGFTGTLYGGDIFLPSPERTLDIQGYVYQDTLVKFHSKVDKPGLGCYLKFARYTGAGFAGMLAVHINFDPIIYWNYVQIKRK